MNQVLTTPVQANLLAVDDTPENLHLLAGMLSDQGYKVRIIPDGQLALKSASVHPPDLILLDILMPEMNGYQVCQALKASPITHNIPIIFISALQEAFDKVKAFEVGGVDYITKPFQMQEVLARIDNQLKIARLQQQLSYQIKLLDDEIRERKKVELALQEANQKLQHLAAVDGLTGIANRRSFDDFLFSKWQSLGNQQAALSLILCDVDYFKYYNDTYGHLAGDDCLKQVAHAITGSVNCPTALVARYGGEEFAVILPEVCYQSAISLAETIRQAVNHLNIPHVSSRVSDYVTVSVGVTSTIPNLYINWKTLIRAADQTLYAAKARGRNCVVSDEVRVVYPSVV